MRVTSRNFYWAVSNALAFLCASAIPADRRRALINKTLEKTLVGRPFLCDEKIITGAGFYIVGGLHKIYISVNFGSSFHLICAEHIVLDLETNYEVAT